MYNFGQIKRGLSQCQLLPLAMISRVKLKIIITQDNRKIKVPLQNSQTSIRRAAFAARFCT